MSDIFHQGELEVQQKTGEVLTATSNSRIISDTIPNRVDSFIDDQTMAIVSSIDDTNNIWVSVLSGKTGFTTVLHPNVISFDRTKILSTQSDIFYKNIKEKKEFGSLFIELSTRRRFRINGTAKIDKKTIEVLIQESYANCPKYIQQRVLNLPNHFEPLNTAIRKGITLNPSIKDWIKQADTFFIGSKSNDNKLDASHRGGNKGFIEITANTLKIPDYKGNSMYNTLGNIHQTSKAGILFIDFEKGNTLQLTGTSSILFDQNSNNDSLKTGGTGRYLLFTAKEWIITKNHHQINWKFLSNSPFNPSNEKS